MSGAKSWPRSPSKCLNYVSSRRRRVGRIAHPVTGLILAAPGRRGARSASAGRSTRRICGRSGPDIAIPAAGSAQWRPGGFGCAAACPGRLCRAAPRESVARTGHRAVNRFTRRPGTPAHKLRDPIHKLRRLQLVNRPHGLTNQCTSGEPPVVWGPQVGGPAHGPANRSTRPCIRFTLGRASPLRFPLGPARNLSKKKEEAKFAKDRASDFTTPPQHGR